MTKNEKQIILDHYAEYKIAYGFYREQQEHEVNEEEKVIIAGTICAMAIKARIVQDILNDLGIEITENYTETGRDKYKQMYNIK